MEKNIGNIDRVIRVVVGVILIVAAALWVSGILSIIFYIIGIILLVTGAIGYCLIQKLFKINTATKTEGSTTETESTEVQELKQVKEKVEEQQRLNFLRKTSDIRFT